MKEECLFSKLLPTTTIGQNVFKIVEVFLASINLIGTGLLVCAQMVLLP